MCIYINTEYWSEYSLIPQSHLPLPWKISGYTAIWLGSYTQALFFLQNALS